MAEAVELRIYGTEEILKRLAQVPVLMNIAMNLAGAQLERAVKIEMSGPRPGKLGVRNDTLRSSVTHDTSDHGVWPNMHIIVGTAVVYAKIHEYGGVIVPKSAKMLSWVGGGYGSKADASGTRYFAKSVTIPARRPFGTAIDREIKSGSLVRIIELTLARGLQGGMP